MLRVNVGEWASHILQRHLELQIHHQWAIEENGCHHTSTNAIEFKNFIKFKQCNFFIDIHGNG